MKGNKWWNVDLFSKRALQARIILTLVLVVLAALYGVALTGRPSSLWAAQGVGLSIVLLAGILTGWWGRSLLGLVRYGEGKEAAAHEERSRILEQKNRQLQTTLQAFKAISSALDLKEVGALAVEQVINYTPFKKASLILGPDERGEFQVAGSRGLSPEYLHQFLGALKGPGKASSPIEWCQLTRQPVVVDNVARDFRTAGLSDLYTKANLEGLITVPLVVQDQFRGALTVYTEQGTHLTTAEISMVSALASQSAVALENARQYTLTVQNRERMDMALQCLQGVASALTRMRVGVSPLLHLVAQAAANLFAPARIRLTVSKATRYPAMVVTEAVNMCEQDEGTLSFSLPILLDGESYGRLDLVLPGAGRNLEAGEVQILQAFAYLTASALGNAALVSEMRQAVEAVEKSYIGTLEALSKALEIRDHETVGHSRRVVQYTLALAQRLRVPEGELIPIMRGALLHDVGKIGIPDAILRKPAPLTEAEWAIMKEHPRIGYEMLRQIDFLTLAAPIILHHHERFDGRGYPGGLAGDDIPLGARIFAVADTYDAITSDRPYRKGRSHEHAVSEVVAARGSQFDPQVVEAFMSLPDEELSRIRSGDGSTG
ncbi:MAG: HD domain-containing phosphohydrolase [Mycobacterium leprae]